MLKYILAAIIVIAVWVLLFVFPDDISILVPIAVTLLVILVLFVIWIARRIRARRAARELEKALAAQAAEQARTARPDMQAEILQMQQEFQRAIGALKASKLGANALYDLPWQMIVGPPGAGKTTALRNSGLQFPYSSGGIKGLGGTRNCDWWMTNEAVMLDTAGRWTTEEDDRDEWMAFLDLIKKFRPQKPLNGIIAAVSMDQIGGAHEEEVNSLARRMRERIDEVQNKLQMSLPVYVLFTKADLVPGFVETFTDLSKMDRGQVWGFTVPLGDPPSDPGMHFSERFDELSSIVERRALRRMGEERKIETRELVHSFPQQFGTLKKNCMEFVGQIFEGSVYGETPMFRGVYFSSGTQEGRPIDRVMHKMAEAFGIRAEANLGEPVTEAKSYFLRDVFLNVVFPDKDIAMRSESEQRRQRRSTYVAAAVIALVALLILALPGWAAANNWGFLGETDDIVRGVDGTVRSDQTLGPNDLRALRERVELLGEYDTAEPFGMSFWMYQDGVHEKLNDYYTTLLTNQVVGPIARADLDEMDTFGRNYEPIQDAIPTALEHAQNYDRLKMHLLTSRPTEEIEPHLDEDEDTTEWLAEHIRDRWFEALGGTEEVDDATSEEMLNQARLYAQLLANEDQNRRENPSETTPDDSIRFPRDDENVSRVRDALNRTSMTNMALNNIIGQIEPLGYDQTLGNLVGTVPPMHATTIEDGERVDARVRGAFTRRAWDTRVREMLEGNDTSVFGEAWVLGPGAAVAMADAEQAEENLRLLRNQYFHQYIVEWRDFIRTIRVDVPDTNSDSLVELQHLTRGTPEAYRLFFQQVLYNTTLPVPEEEGDSEEGSAIGDTAWDMFRRRLQRIRGGRVIADLIEQNRGGQDEQTDDEDLTPEHVYLAFEAFTQIGATPPPPAPPEGQEPPPPPQVPLAAYEEQLHGVRDALQAYLDNPQESNEALQTALQTARTTTRALIESQDIEAWRPRLEALLWPPIQGSADSVAMGEAGAAGRSWCTEVYMPYHRNILGGYPLNPSGHDVPLADFGAFYLPEEGTLWTFYADVLERRIPKEGDTFVFATNVGQQASRAYRRELLQYLERAGDITNTFFPPGAEGPTVMFDARILPSPRVATTEFCVGGVCVEHHNGPERWQRYTWPGESPEAGATLEVRGAGGIHERLDQNGEWGLYRLLEQGTVTSTSRGNRVFTMTWRLRDHQVDMSMQIRPVRGDAPFFGVRGRERNAPLLQPLRGRHVDPPRQIASGPNRCRVN